MLKQLLSDNRIFGAIVCVLVFVAAGLLYLQTVKHETRRDIQRTQERLQQPSTPETGEAVPQTTNGGHYHADGTYHAEPHGTQTPSAPPTETLAGQRPTGGGYWANGTWHPPAGYVPSHPRGQTSSNPYFAEGVPEHLKCPQKWIGVYRWATSDWTAVREKVRQISREVREKYNPNRPIHEVWPRFIDDELFYQANADIPPFAPEMSTDGATPERAKAVDRIDWYIQHVLDYPEVIALMYTDRTNCFNAWRMELGFDPPDWNVVTLVDGRKFRSRSDHRYKFTFTDGNQTFTDTYSHSGGPDAPLVEINLNETSDEELEALGTDYSIIPYRQGGK